MKNKSEGFNFTSSGTSGNYTNVYGNGRTSLHFHNAGNEEPWTDIGDIYFTNPSKTQLESMETAPLFTEEQAAYVDHKRRLSFKQAAFLQEKISKFLMEEFKGYFPSDEEIDIIKKEK